MTDDNPQPHNMKAALAQLAGSQRALRTMMGELREVRDENDGLRRAMEVKCLLTMLDGICLEAQIKQLVGMIDTLQVENARLLGELQGAELALVCKPECPRNWREDRPPYGTDM